jgi:cell wall-associated NlpC family hydrolase
LTEFRSELVEDRRTDRFEVTWITGKAGAVDTLRGYTTIPGAVDRFREKWSETASKTPHLEVRLLPDEVVGDQQYALVRVSVANLRSKPGHSQELATQALLGTPLRVLDEKKGWYLVRTPDRYLAWLEAGALTRVDGAQLEEWFSDDLRYCSFPNTLVYTSPNQREILTDLVAGNLVKSTGNFRNSSMEVQLPDGAIGWVKSAALERYQGWSNPTALSTDNLLLTANKLAGRPYLWGGTSSKGMDCSGFTKMTYYMNGYVIPRDASQQVHAGSPVSLEDNFSGVEPGDLLFFGNYRDDGSERITHVGCYLGDGHFIHSGADNGRISVNSLRPEDDLFAAHRLESLMRAKRLVPGTEGVSSIQEAFAKIVEH